MKRHQKITDTRIGGRADGEYILEFVPLLWLHRSWKWHAGFLDQFVD